jgi:hypothetical protein
MLPGCQRARRSRVGGDSRIKQWGHTEKYLKKNIDKFIEQTRLIPDWRVETFEIYAFLLFIFVIANLPEMMRQ